MIAIDLSDIIDSGCVEGICMKTVTFPLALVNEHRRRAVRACQVPRDGPEGWSVSEVNPMQLLQIFDSLRLMDGFILRAYQYRDDGDGHGIIWAMRDDAKVAAPDASTGFPPPRPPETLDNIMQAIQGDGTPWSYLSASLFAREAVECGAMWHGCDWMTHIILGNSPWDTPKNEYEHIPTDGPTGHPDAWQWLERKPNTWEPGYHCSADTVTVTFHTFSGFRREAIHRWTDTYRKRHYDFVTSRITIAEGPEGYIF